MALKLLHEYTTTNRVVTDIRMQNAKHALPETDEQIPSYLKPCKYQVTTSTKIPY